MWGRVSSRDAYPSRWACGTALPLPMTQVSAWGKSKDPNRARASEGKAVKPGSRMGGTADGK